MLSLFAKLVLTATIVFSSCTGMAAEDVTAIAEADMARWNAALAQKNVDSIVSLFSTDAMLIQPNGEVARDADKIRRFWQSMLNAQRGQSRLNLIKARQDHDDTIVTRATLTDTKTLEQPDEVLKYNYQGVVNNVLKRQADGSWKVQVQRWNDGSKLQQ